MFIWSTVNPMGGGGGGGGARAREVSPNGEPAPLPVRKETKKSECSPNALVEYS